jgi:hypothetical protein
MQTHSSRFIWRYHIFLVEMSFKFDADVVNLLSINFRFDVVEDKKAALKLLKKLIPKGASVMNGHSTTFNEIGLTEHLKTQTEWDNLHGPILAEKDQGKAAELRSKANLADYWLSSVCAFSAEGDLVVADLTGTRVSGFLTAKNVIVVVGAQKFTKDYNDAAKRTKKFCLPVESARVRVAYGVPASTINNYLAIRGLSPWGGAGRIHVIVIKEHLGF